MAGVLFVICVPTENYEKTLKKCRDGSSTLSSVDVTEENVKTSSSAPNFNYYSHDIASQTSEDAGEDYLLKNTLMQSKSSSMSINKGSYQSKSSERIEVTSSTYSDQNDFSNMTLEKVLRKILQQQNIKNAVWTKGESAKYIQVIFPSESGKKCEGILTILNAYGIGQRLNSVVSVIPCSLYYKDEENIDKSDSGEEEINLHLKREHAKNTAWNRFVTSVRARLTVAQVVESVKANASFTFDFLILLIVATILSAIALAENNNVYLVSSMLISPMMGPVMAGTFGTVIQDKKLQKMGILNELLGVGIATAVGFCYGVIITSFTDKYGENDWPTYEMSSRGEVRTLWVGCLIAILSGAAVALGILGDNIASLVGVAISASLMPPAVNAGLLWAMAVVYAFAGQNSSKSIIRTHFYFYDDVGELAALGGISMCLTFVNIVCIYIAGILVFKIKEVAPLSSRDHSRQFWKYDIKIARDYNRTLQSDDAKVISKLLSTEAGSYNEKMPLLAAEASHRDRLLNLADHLYQSTEFEREPVPQVRKVQYTWSPSTFAPKRPTVQELKKLYFSLTDNKSKVERNLNFHLPDPKNEPSNCEANTEATQIYIPNEEGVLSAIPENIAGQTGSVLKPHTSGRLVKKAAKGTRKFVVTPATIDNPH